MNYNLLTHNITQYYKVLILKKNANKNYTMKQYIW